VSGTGVILLVFFLVGIAAGIVMVIAMSARRTGRPERQGGADEDAGGHSWPPEPDVDEPGDDLGKPPWWSARPDC
jgi:hypothetical protein